MLRKNIKLKISIGICIMLSFLLFLTFNTQHKDQADIAKNFHKTDTPKPHAKKVTNIRVHEYLSEGEYVQYFTKVPEKVIVVGSSEIESLLGLDIVEPIAASEPWYPLEDFLPKKLHHLIPKVHLVTYGNLSLEYMLFLEPDLLVAQQCTFTAKRFISTDFWNKRGVHTFVPWNTNNPSGHQHVETIENEMKFLRGLGDIFHREKEAEAYIQSVYDTIDFVKKSSAKFPKPEAVVIEFFGEGIASYDKTKLAGDMVTRLGGKIKETEPMIDYETLIDLNPDVIFIVCYGKEDAKRLTKLLLENKALNSISAIKKKHITPLLLEYVYSSEMRTEKALRVIAKGLYPDMEGLGDTEST